MKGWTPLWSTIIDSSVWGESKEVKILWITMLAKKDREGIVWGALPGLARAAVLELSECEAALRVLMLPDPNSTSKEHDGRRIEIVPGGWKVLNHEIYRTAMSAEYRKDYNARKQREYRSKKKAKGPTEREDRYVKAVENGASEQTLADIAAEGLPEGNI